jgi:hypothetical protein
MSGNLDILAMHAGALAPQNDDVLMLNIFGRVYQSIREMLLLTLYAQRQFACGMFGV